MIILLRRSWVFWGWRLALVCALLGLLLPTPVQADVGVQPILPGGSNLKPGEKTAIQMAAEVITMNIRAATEADNALLELNPTWYSFDDHAIWYAGIAEVEVDFTMKNPTGLPVNMIVWFPLAAVLKTHAWEGFSAEEIVPRIEQFKVSVDGMPLDHTVSELPNPNGADKPLLPWASFPVTFAGEKETFIHVSYGLPLQQPAKSSNFVLYYIFQTGAGWAGPIGQAELILNLPYPASTETLSGMPSGSLNPPYFIYTGDEVAGLPPGAVFEGNRARWMWKNLEPGPEDDFSILLMHPGVWKGLEAERTAVRNAPGDGQAWFRLCATYFRLSTRSFLAAIPTSYSTAYAPRVEETCREAARLLPGDAGPHYVLARFLSSALEENPSLETLRPVWIELKIAQALEAGQASSEVYLPGCDPWTYSSNSECIEADLANAFRRTPGPQWYSSASDEVTRQVGTLFSNATATAGWAAVTREAEATLRSRASATVTPTRQPSLTPSRAPSATPPPAPTPLPAAPEPAIDRRGQILLLAVGAAGLAAIAHMFFRKLRHSAETGDQKNPRPP